MKDAPEDLIGSPKPVVASAFVPKNAAIKAEAEGKTTIEISFGGNEYLFPINLDEADGSVLDALDEGKLSIAIKELLGKDQWLKFKRTKPSVRMYGEILNTYMAAMGVESLGN
jgi:hypothetical protein